MTEYPTQKGYNNVACISTFLLCSTQSSASHHPALWSVSLSPPQTESQIAQRDLRAIAGRREGAEDHPGARASCHIRPGVRAGYIASDGGCYSGA